MNERIRELAIKAGMTRILNEHAHEYGNGVFENTPYPELEKFVELLVKDCMAMTDELKAQYLTSRKSTMDFDEKNIYAEGEAACDILRYKMKKQFGVEE